MPYTHNVSQNLAVVGKIVPASTQTTTLTDAIDLSKYRRVLFIIQAGALGASATVDFSVKGCATSGGSYVALDATNAAITQLTKAGTDDNKIVLMEVRAEKVAALNLGYIYIKGELITGTAASLCSVVALGAVANYQPASAGNLAVVDEIKVY